MKNTPSPEYRAPALEKGLEILELLATQAEPLSKKQIAEKLGRSVNEIFRMLLLLEQKNYLGYDLDSATYSLTLKMFTLSNQHPPIALLLKQAPALLEQLCDRINQSCHLSHYQHGELVVIARQESPYKMGFSLRLGAKLSICNSGSGIILLAYSNPQQRNQILAQLEDTADEKNQALAVLEQTLAQGYFVGPSPQISGVTNISVPILNVHGGLLAVATIPFLSLNENTVHHPVDDLEHTRQQLLKMAKKLSHNLSLEA
ncbi:IclR family transcriptional regulator [Agarivorans sp. Z349TD_8]|uniref:IclR family transcriptional regulator n=1 Tax=Agarivorans sp. Z349TD_8 TaxID=3421434 RepID=UPI003D7E133D